RRLRERILTAYPKGIEEEEALLGEIEIWAQKLELEIETALKRHSIRVVHLRNILSLPYLHLPAAVAFERLIRKHHDMRFVVHTHDATWEGPVAQRYQCGYPRSADVAMKVLLPKAKNVRHVVINSLTAQELMRRRGIRAVVVPDGFNFGKVMRV